jgi:hypothetical protein
MQATKEYKQPYILKEFVSYFPRFRDNWLETMMKNAIVKGK